MVLLSLFNPWRVTNKNVVLFLIHTHTIEYQIFSNNAHDAIMEWHFSIHSNSILVSLFDYKDSKAKCYIFQILLQLDTWIWHIEATQVLISRSICKQKIVYITHNIIQPKKGEDILIYTTRINLEDIILNAISSHKKDKCYMISRLWGVYSSEIMETESRTVVSRSWGEGRKREVVCTGCRVSVCKVKRVLEIGCTALHCEYTKH